MQQRTIGPFSVSALGLGCMKLSHAYGLPVSVEQGVRLLLSALDAGVTLFDSAALYGSAANETLLGSVTMARLDALINPSTVVGPRYSAQSQSEVDSEVF